MSISLLNMHNHELYVYGYNVKQMNNSIFSGPTQLQVIHQQTLITQLFDRSQHTRKISDCF